MKYVSRSALGLVLALLLPSTATALGTAPGDIAAFIKGHRGEVALYQEQFSPSGRKLGKAWVDVEQDDPVYIEDVIRTGPGARAVIEFADRYEVDGFVAGPSIFTLGPESTAAIANFEIDYDRAGKPQPRGIFELIEGTIRNFIKGWGQRSHFSVRAGVAVCGLRGTDVTFDYQPYQQRLTVTVHEGKVVVTSPEGSKIVEAAETIVFDNIQPTRKAPESNDPPA